MAYPFTPSLTFHPVGRRAEIGTLRAFHHADRRGWSLLRARLAALLDVEDDERITETDVYWGGEHGDENSVEVVMLDGAIIGTLDKPIDDAELAAIEAPFAALLFAA